MKGLKSRLHIHKAIIWWKQVWINASITQRQQPPLLATKWSSDAFSLHCALWMWWKYQQRPPSKWSGSIARLSSVHLCFHLCHFCACVLAKINIYNQVSRIEKSTLHDGKVHGADMGPIWGRQDPGGPHVGPMKFAIWVPAKSTPNCNKVKENVG